MPFRILKSSRPVSLASVNVVEIFDRVTRETNKNASCGEFKNVGKQFQFTIFFSCFSSLFAFCCCCFYVNFSNFSRARQLKNFTSTSVLVGNAFLVVVIKWKQHL
jgi:hypothetical protein